MEIILNMYTYKCFNEDYPILKELGMNDEDILKGQLEKPENNLHIEKESKKYNDLKKELKLKTIILDTANQPILVHDIKGNFVFVNETACISLGYTKNELMKLNLHDIDIPEFTGLIKPRIEELTEKKELTFQSAHFRKDESVIPIEVHARILEFNGETFIISTVRDITKYKKTEKEVYKYRKHLEEVVRERTVALKMANEALNTEIKEHSQTERNLRWNVNLIRSMAENSPLAFYVVDNRTDSILYFNYNFCKMWGLESLQKTKGFLCHRNQRFRGPKRSSFKGRQIYDLWPQNYSFAGSEIEAYKTEGFVHSKSAILKDFESFEEDIKEGKIKNNDVILELQHLISDKESFMELHKPFQSEENRLELEDEISLVDGRTIRLFSKQIRDPEDQYFGRLYLFEDISERKRIEKAIKDREEHLSLITDNMFDLIYQVNSKGIFEYVSPSIKDLLGYEPQDIIGKQDFELINIVHPDDLGLIIDALQVAVKTLKPNRVQHRYKHADGHYIWVETVGNPLSNDKGEFSGAVYITRDITELKNVENQLKSSLEEKEVLLQEIHHRVKNNMQIISSLLNLQSRYLNDEEAVNVLKESQNRVKSMTIVHEELYRSQDLSKIDFAEYIQRLLSGLFSSYGVNPEFIKPKVNVENIFIDIDTAVPCGLIINELVSNSLKHAFLSGQKGEISVRFYLNDKKYTLIVEDNGIGFPKNIDFKNINTLGLQLVSTLVKQLSGEIELHKNKGSTFKIIF